MSGRIASNSFVRWLEARIAKRASHRAIALVGVLGALTAFGACAHMMPPPGGVADKIPPKIISITPGDSSTGVTPGAVVFTFDKVVSEQPVGATTLHDLAVISPVQGAVNADWHRHAIAISPDKGWRKNTTYTIQLLAGVADLWGNVRKQDTTIIFSTGPTIPKTTVHGTVFDWEHGTPVAGAFVQAYSPKDSLFTYVAVTDSLGGFTLHALPAAQTYVVRGIMDANRNRSLDPGEAFDTVSVTLNDSARVELLAFAHDTIGPRLSSMHVDDSVTVRVTFSALLDPTQTPEASQFTIKGPDSSVVQIVRVGPQPKDTTTPAVDTAARNAQQRAANAANAASYGTSREQREAQRNAQRKAQSDSVSRFRTARNVPLPKPSKPSPYRDLLVTVATPLTPKTEYTVHATDVRGVGGTKKSSDGTFTVPAVIAKSAADSAKAAKPSNKPSPTLPIDTTKAPASASPANTVRP